MTALTKEQREDLKQFIDACEHETGLMDRNTVYALLASAEREERLEKALQEIVYAEAIVCDGGEVADIDVDGLKDIARAALNRENTDE